MTTPRVVSLVPSVTESLLAWGVTPVACTRFCEQPTLLHVGGTKDPDLDAIVRLAPDLVVLCEEENLLEHHDALVAAGVACHAVRIDAVEDVPGQLAGIPRALGIDVPPTELVAPRVGAPSVRAFVPIWRRPLMTLSPGTYGASLLRSLGIDTLFADATVRYPTTDLDAVAALHPDVVLVPTEPYPFTERHLAEWQDIAPARLVDGQDLFWWGTRTPAAVRRLQVALADLLGGAD